MAEIFREIDKAVGLLDAESQIEHVKWKNAWKAEEQMRLQLFKVRFPLAGQGFLPRTPFPSFPPKSSRN